MAAENVGETENKIKKCPDFSHFTFTRLSPEGKRLHMPARPLSQAHKMRHTTHTQTHTHTHTHTQTHTHIQHKHRFGREMLSYSHFRDHCTLTVQLVFLNTIARHKVTRFGDYPLQTASLLAEDNKGRGRFTISVGDGSISS